MGTKSGTLAIVLPDTTALAKLPQFTEAVAALNILDGELSVIEQTVRGIKIVDKATFQQADTLNKRSKEIVKEAEEIVKPYKAPLRKWLDLVQREYNVVSNHQVQLNGILQPQMQVFSELEFRQAKVEEERLQKDLNKQYKNTGQAVPEVTVPAGVRSGRTYYSAHCTNQSAYIKAVCDAYKTKDRATFDRLVLMLEVSDRRLAEEADKTKNNEQMKKWYPFVEATSRKSF